MTVTYGEMNGFISALLKEYKKATGEDLSNITLDVVMEAVMKEANSQ